MRCIVGLVGTGGYGRETMPVLRCFIEERKPEVLTGMEIDFCFVESNPTRSFINDNPVLSWDAFIEAPYEKKYFNVAIANSALREKFADMGINHGAIPLGIYSQHSLRLSHNEIGPGAILSPFSAITANARIGKFFHANIYSYVAHDCVIGDFVTFAPNVCCNGNVVIEDHAYIGTGAIIKQGTDDRPLRIGRSAIVGMGAVVTKDVPAGTTVVGNPAKELVRTN